MKLKTHFRRKNASRIMQPKPPRHDEYETIIILTFDLIY